MTRRQPFTGPWRIVELELCDRDELDLSGPAHFTFGNDGGGEFRFIAVEGNMDCRFGQMDGKPRVDFTWDGNDECDPVSGRGWATLEGDVITGRIFFHGGDDSAFMAKRVTVKALAAEAARLRREARD